MSEDGQNKAEGAPAAAAAAATGTMDVFQALQQVLKTALIHDGVARGLRECVKALDRREAHLCVLASNCDEPNFVALVRALCDEHSIKLIKVPESKQLGEWVGLCKIDEEGNARKVVPCACAVVKDFGEDSNALQILLDYLKTRGSAE